MGGEDKVSDEVALARIEGKINQINDRLESGQRAMTDISGRCAAVELRTAALEAKIVLEDGVKRGERRMLSLVIGLASVCGMSGLAAAAKILMG